MAAIDDLIAQIEDKALRERLRMEMNRITKEKKFGLVFENHLPELTPTYSAKVRRHSKVALRDGPLTDLWRALSVRDGEARCCNISSGETRQIPVDDLVVVRQFGEPIFPALVSVDKVQNGLDDAPWHTLIEADNYHALQLLEYLYAGKVDCIYIDPPYNTGARDWKYNNDYVDQNDRWRHSKWLAFMRRRLILAKSLLSKEGILITTIDDNEFAHLWMVFNEIFPSYEHFVVTIQHNPGGTQGGRFSVVHEYAIFTVCTTSVIYKKAHTGEDTYNLRRWGSTSGRFEGATCFYPIYVQEDGRIAGFGDVPSDSFNPKSQVTRRKNGILEVWPIDKNGIEKKWRYGRGTVESIRHRLFSQNTGDRIEIKIRREAEALKTIWTDKLYNADYYGSGVISTVLGGGFQYPKSLYAVRDSIAYAVNGNKNALVLDFFSGSGTTLHAVNLLNIRDTGSRQCIMITNNEVSEGEAKSLSNKGIKPGQIGWEQQGICQSITWPRSKYTILGRRDDGTVLEGEYLTGKTSEMDKPRKFQQIAFTTIDDLNTAAKKKQLVALIDGIPQSEVKKDSAFVVSEKHSTSILFDESQADAWLEVLEDQEHITDFYIVTVKKVAFENLKVRIQELLGPVIVTEEEKHPMCEGFPANLEYFRLDFLDKDHVALGRQFREILPILWLRAGAIGPRPELPKNRPIPAMVIPEHNPFAVLVEENRFADFTAELEGRDDLTHAYLVTDSEEAFQEMAVKLKVPNVIQLYRDYLENFVINKGEGAS